MYIINNLLNLLKIFVINYIKLNKWKLREFK
jgi:hypothetical protein